VARHKMAAGVGRGRRRDREMAAGGACVTAGGRGRRREEAGRASAGGAGLGQETKKREDAMLRANSSPADRKGVQVRRVTTMLPEVASLLKKPVLVERVLTN